MMTELARRCLVNNAKANPVGWKRLPEETRQALRTTTLNLKDAAEKYGVCIKTAWKYRQEAR